MGQRRLNPKQESKTAVDSVSIVIPGYNEADRIRPTLEHLAAFCTGRFEPCEIVVVDDGSFDDTVTVVRRVQAECPAVIRLIRHGRNLGKGCAVRTGMLAATGRYRFFTDADLPYDTRGFLTAYGLLSGGAVDMVAGDRFLPASGTTSGTTWQRRLASRLFAAFTGSLFHIGARDTQCGFKGFTARAAQSIFTRTTLTGYAFDVEIFLVARQMGFTVGRVPVTLVRNDTTRIHLMRDGLSMFLDLLRLYRRTFRG